VKAIEAISLRTIWWQHLLHKHDEVTIQMLLLLCQGKYSLCLLTPFGVNTREARERNEEQSRRRDRSDRSDR
jgi:hypothetical protein